MTSEFVTYEQALALKELGFDEPCFAYYSINNIENKLFYDIDSDDGELTALNQNQFYYNNLSEVGRISSPLKQQVFRWFRERHDLLSWVFTPFGVSNGYFHEIVNLSNIVLEGGFSSGQSAQYTTYEEAELSCIDELIEIVKTKKL